MNIKSSSNSYSKCDICMNEVSINNFKNHNCKHDWCNMCDKKLEKFNIETCPFCRRELNDKGKWELKKYSRVVIWKWKNGKNETLRTKILKKFQENLLNLGTSIALIRGRAI